MKQHEQARGLLKKAGQDESLVQEVLTAKNISDEIIGFHCQQAIEKFFKALLSCHAVRFRKTHDLREIMDLLADSGHAVPDDLQDVDKLTVYASLLRYEANVVTSPLDRNEAASMVSRVREWVEQQIPE